MISSAKVFSILLIWMKIAHTVGLAAEQGQQVDRWWWSHEDHHHNHPHHQQHHGRHHHHTADKEYQQLERCAPIIQSECMKMIRYQIQCTGGNEARDSTILSFLFSSVLKGITFKMIGITAFFLVWFIFVLESFIEQLIPHIEMSFIHIRVRKWKWPSAIKKTRTWQFSSILGLRDPILPRLCRSRTLYFEISKELSQHIWSHTGKLSIECCKRVCNCCHRDIIVLHVVNHS